jgi:hypothetical protein
MWIDADAIIIDFSVDIWRNIIERGCNKDLIIAEDMNPGCLLNSGVFLLRTTQWSADFLEEVWKSTKHDAVFFYEQSAMISMLKVKFEFFEDGTTPFHSYLPGADPGIKFMPHVAVFPHWELNTHRGIAKSDLVSKEHYLNVYSADRLDTGSLSCQTEASTTGRADYQQAAAAAGGDVFAWQSRDDLVDHLIVTSDRLDCDDGQRTAADSNTDNCEMIVQQQGGGISINNRDIGLKEHSQKTTAADCSGDCSARPRFIYHPAGMPNKLSYILAAIRKWSIPIDVATIEETDQLRLDRGKMGQIHRSIREKCLK